jgi:hypothetical protein
MKITNIKRIVKEDFKAEDRELIEKLSFVLNPILEQLNNAFNKNIDFDNLNRELITFEVTLDAQGIPTSTLEIKSGLKGKCRGLNVMSVTNLTDNTLPTGAPFITFGLNGNNIQIQHITGLVANKKYRIVMESIG